MNTKIIHVNIGEVKIGRPGEVLKATLGSCVGIIFAWEEKKLYGLAHCLLPRTNEEKFVLTAKYVNQAIPSLIKLMGLSEDKFSEVKVYVGGGSNMLVQLSRSNPDHIGVQNKQATIQNLREIGLKIQHKDFGGEQGRIVTVDCNTGEVLFKLIDKGKVI